MKPKNTILRHGLAYIPPEERTGPPADPTRMEPVWHYDENPHASGCGFTFDEAAEPQEEQS